MLPAASALASPREATVPEAVQATAMQVELPATEGTAPDAPPPTPAQVPTLQQLTQSVLWRTAVGEGWADVMVQALQEEKKGKAALRKAEPKSHDVVMLRIKCSEDDHVRGYMRIETEPWLAILINKYTWRCCDWNYGRFLRNDATWVHDDVYDPLGGVSLSFPRERWASEWMESQVLDLSPNTLAGMASLLQMPVPNRLGWETPDMTDFTRAAPGSRAYNRERERRQRHVLNEWLDSLQGDAADTQITMLSALVGSMMRRFRILVNSCIAHHDVGDGDACLFLDDGQPADVVYKNPLLTSDEVSALQAKRCPLRIRANIYVDTTKWE
tara:strand:- start:1164 stop:2147 length:984 start_codon:yes stop_codon:yes gene_type:complete